jgi:hypothetical protein
MKVWLDVKQMLGVCTVVESCVGSGRSDGIW